MDKYVFLLLFYVSLKKKKKIKKWYFPLSQFTHILNMKNIHQKNQTQINFHKNIFKVHNSQNPWNPLFLTTLRRKKSQSLLPWNPWVCFSENPRRRRWREEPNYNGIITYSKAKSKTFTTDNEISSSTLFEIEGKELIFFNFMGILETDQLQVN